MARIAVVGGGISGLYACYLLHEKHELTLYEADGRLGGHADTQNVMCENGALPIDTGFIVFNETNYPLFSKMLRAFNIKMQDSRMSFSVRDNARNFEYCASENWTSLFSDRTNLVRPGFYRMLGDLKRFYNLAEGMVEQLPEQMSLAEYLFENQFSQEFADWHLVPMAAALWSTNCEDILQYPIKYMLQFMRNHHMLQLSGRPKWKTITGGSAHYVSAIRDQLNVRYRLSDDVQNIRRSNNIVQIKSRSGDASFDAVILACHSDQALSLLSDASDNERSILSSIPYQENVMCLHTDHSVMPKKRRSWASWNVNVDNEQRDRCFVTYHMNQLQNLKTKKQYFVSLNQEENISPSHILVKKAYHHPMYTAEGVKARSRWPEINRHRTFFAGAYWGWGFHEDGARSAVAVSQRIDEMEL